MHQIKLTPFLLFLIFYSCSNKTVSIKYIQNLTEISSDTTIGKKWINRDDYFIIYNSKFSSDLKNDIDIAVKPYIDSFSTKFSNYSIHVFKESKFADTSYINKFGEGYYYKALLDDKPYLELQWWDGKLITK